MAFPSVSLDVVDDFTGSDGPLDPTKWDSSSGYDGSSVGVGIAGNQAAASTTAGQALGLFALDPNFEASLDIATASTNYVAWFFNVTGGGDSSNWQAYWVLTSDDDWSIHKRLAGQAGVELNAITGPVLAGGDKVGIRRLDEAIEVYHYTAGAWNQTPVITASDGDLLTGGTMALDVQNTVWRLDNLSAGTLSGGVTGAVSLHVNADHPDASDEQLRSQVTADTPLLTVLKAAQLARGVASDSADDSDEIVVWKAAGADPANATDAGVYAGFTHNFGLGFLPFGNNSGNKPIIVRGVNAAGETPADDSERPRWLGFDATLLNNWQFEDLHFGYEFQSGDDVLTIRTLSQPVDLQWRRCMWTGGAYTIRNATGLMRWEDCEITSMISEFLGQGGRNLDGVGFKIVNSSEQGEDFRCHFEFDSCFIHHVQGEDAFQVGTGAPDQADTYIHWTDCVWEDCVQLGEDGSAENPVGIHTDCVQVLGGPEYKWVRCSFRRCTSCIQASDFRNGLIHIENTMFAGAAIESPADAGIPVTIQGTDELVMISNTIVNSGFGIAVLLLYKYAPSTGSTDLVWINNIFDGVSQSSDVVIGTYEDNSNLIGSAHGSYEIPETSIQGFTEFGSTEATVLELANSPVSSPATDAGVKPGDDARVPTTDRLGRARTGTAPDIGCHESPTTTIPASARPPHILDAAPTGTGVSATTDVTVRFLPKPGETVDEASITSSSAFVTDLAGQTIPAQLTLSDADVDGYQQLTIDLLYSTSPAREGRLDPLVTYTAHLTSAIEDTEGSAIAATTWDFRVAGRSGPAITRLDSGPVGLRSIRTASFLTVGPSTAGFEQPNPSASFEQAEAVVVR